jgi:hypothetical protein
MYLFISLMFRVKHHKTIFLNLCECLVQNQAVWSQLYDLRMRLGLRNILYTRIFESTRLICAEALISIPSSV